MLGILHFLIGKGSAPTARPEPARKIRRRSRLGEIVETQLRSAKPSIRLRPARVAGAGAQPMRSRPSRRMSSGSERTTMPERIVWA